MIASALNASLAGVQRNLEKLDGAARRIARDAPLQGDLARDLVELTVARRGAQASLKVMRTADEMVGSLLDVLA